MNTFLNTLYTQNTKTTQFSFDPAKFNIPNTKISTEYTTVENPMNKRVHAKVYKRAIFSKSADKGAKSNNELVRQCNGLIIDCKTGAVICMPTPIAIDIKSSKMQEKLVNMSADEYDVFAIYDGTIINLYWYDSKWCMGTASGYDVSEFTSLADTTYKSVFAGVCEQFGVDLDALDKTRSYTFGMTHNSFHPYNSASRLWFIQSFDLKKFNSGAAYDKCVCYDSVGIDAEVAIDKSLMVKECKFGYMLRAKNSSKNVNVLVRTHLMEDIAQLIYDIPNRMLYNMYKRKYIAFRAFLSPIYSALFVELFPQYKEIYTILDNKLIDISNFIIKIEKARCVKSYSIAGANRIDYKNDELFPIYEFLMEHSNIKALDFLDENIYLIVYDLIKNNKFLQYYLDCL